MVLTPAKIGHTRAHNGPHLCAALWCALFCPQLFKHQRPAHRVGLFFVRVTRYLYHCTMVKCLFPPLFFIFFFLYFLFWQAVSPEFENDYEVTNVFPWGKFTLRSGHIGPKLVRVRVRVFVCVCVSVCARVYVWARVRYMQRFVTERAFVVVALYVCSLLYDPTHSCPEQRVPCILVFSFFFMTSPTLFLSPGVHTPSIEPLVRMHASHFSW